ncbi:MULTISPECIES: VWA domain-containing protein [Chryseobacterium]|uniref:VWA domain-containing protein n=1 Tax=Chryseobacterium oryzae TaxID=2929799 RepID=A0ABY4BMK1_9FLAO|nr:MULTISPECIES: VWA domain-containing protein [Chryseobacterium]UOE39001.1 VWA domain-containing protein [Chryseobacterium oryzae]
MFNLDFEFYSPWFFLLFLVFLPLLFRDFSQKKRKGVKVPTIQNMDENNSILPVLSFLKISKYIILSALIIAMARPRTFSVSQERDETKGVDIMLAVDVSLSMFSKDFEPDRYSVLKNIAVDFIRKRPNDRFGLVNYKMEAFLKVPLTFDHNAVIHEIENLNQREMMDGTSVGDGLAVAVNHLVKSKAKSKVVILMTDGVSNKLNGLFPPQVAAILAKDNNIKVYCIGIGTNGYALMPYNYDEFGFYYTEQQVSIDEDTLKEIAATTGGKYYRADSENKLQEIYSDINKLEKTDLKVTKNYNYEEHFRIFLWIAFGVLILDAVLRWILYKFLS